MQASSFVASLPLQNIQVYEGRSLLAPASPRSFSNSNRLSSFAYNTLLHTFKSLVCASIPFSRPSRFVVARCFFGYTEEENRLFKCRTPEENNRQSESTEARVDELRKGINTKHEGGKFRKGSRQRDTIIATSR
jgi:hypothetical protein